MPFLTKVLETMKYVVQSFALCVPHIEGILNIHLEALAFSSLLDAGDTNLDDVEVGADNCIGDGKAAKLVQSVLSDMT